MYKCTNKRAIGDFQKYHNTLCLSPKILHKHCFYFLLGLKMVSRENKNNAYAKLWKTNKECYGIFKSGLLDVDTITYFIRPLANLSIEAKWDLHVFTTTKTDI